MFILIPTKRLMSVRRETFLIYLFIFRVRLCNKHLHLSNRCKSCYFISVGTTIRLEVTLNTNFVSFSSCHITLLRMVNEKVDRSNSKKPSWRLRRWNFKYKEN